MDASSATPRLSPCRVSQRNLTSCCILAALGLWTAMAGPWLAGRLYVFDDLGAFHLPLRVFYSTCLERGEPFDWMPQLYCGWFLTGEGQAGTYHPWHFLLYSRCAWPTAFGLEVLSSYPFAWIGYYLWLRPRAGRTGAAFGALVGSFSEFALLHFPHTNAVAIVAHIPWLLWLQDVAFRAETSRRRTTALVGIAWLTASQLLLGYPQYVWFSLLTEAGYALAFHNAVTRFKPFTLFSLRTCPSPPTPLPQGERGEPSSLLPPGEGGRRPDEGMLERSVPSPRPSPGGRGGRSRDVVSPRRALALLSAAKLLGVLLGSVQLLPTVQALRESTRATVDASFQTSGSLHPLNALQLVAPYAWESRVVGQNTHELGLYCGAVSLVLAVWLVIHWPAAGRNRRLTIALLVGAAMAVLFACGQYAPLYRLQQSVPLVNSFRFPCRAICLMHLAIAGIAAVAFRQLSRTALPPSRATTRNRSSAPAMWTLVGFSWFTALSLALWSPPETLAQWPLVIAGPLLIMAAAALVLAAERGVAAALPALVVLAAVDLGAYGLSYAVYPGAVDAQQWLATLPPEPATPGARRSFERASPSDPHVGNQLLLVGWRRGDGYSGLQPAYERNLAQGEPAAPRATLEPPVVGDTLRVLHDRPGRIVVETTTTAPSRLVVNESFHAGWCCQVSGRRGTLYRAEGDFLAISLPAGRSIVEFRFDPASLRWGRAISLSGLGLSFCWLAVGSARGRTEHRSIVPV